MVVAGTVEATVTPDQIAGECDVLASEVMNSSDLGRSGTLQIHSEALWRRSDVGGSSPGSTADQAGLIIPDCFLEYIGRRGVDRKRRRARQQAASGRLTVALPGDSASPAAVEQTSVRICSSDRRLDFAP